jgi:Cu2+-exporting ATPase
MIGDGLNDGPGLEAAHCAATPAVDHPSLPGRVDFYFLGEGVGAVSRALRAARRLRSLVHGNLALALAYNLLALTFCYLGMVTPVVAAVLMPLSSVTVVLVTAFRSSGRRLRWMS